MSRRQRVLGQILVLALACACRPPEPEPVNADREQLEPRVEAPACDGRPCEPPRECISYFGIAGPSGPQFHACELRCESGAPNEGCPEGMRCVTIADGPGDVCRDI